MQAHRQRQGDGTPSRLRVQHGMCVMLRSICPLKAGAELSTMLPCIWSGARHRVCGMVPMREVLPHRHHLPALASGQRAEGAPRSYCCTFPGRLAPGLSPALSTVNRLYDEPVTHAAVLSCTQHYAQYYPWSYQMPQVYNYAVVKITLNCSLTSYRGPNVVKFVENSNCGAQLRLFVPQLPTPHRNATLILHSI